MILVELKPLVEKLNVSCRQALENAAGSCLSRTNYEISVEHLLNRMIDDAQCDMSLMLVQQKIDVGLLKRAIEQAIEDMQSGNTGRPTFSPLLLELFQDAWLISSVDFRDKKIRSGHIFLALLNRSAFFASGSYIDIIKKANRQSLLDGFSEITANSIENAQSPLQDDAHGSPTQDSTEEVSALTRFCEDFTAKARAGKIDPVFGRDMEIRQMVDILARRRKNNPICVGDPGVGKSAVVEGLALRISQGDIPDSLKEVSILGLDMGSLQAGASVKGEFEKRLKAVIDEVKASPKPIVLFIDEAHTIIGAGGPTGGSDAANLLKPALARGELRTIAATTWAEYKKYFEKDPALTRRFQLVKLDEPDLKTTAIILRGLKDSYEQVHQIVVRDDALTAAAELSARYITGRKLPDKAVDLLDTACARVKVLMGAKPVALEVQEREAQALMRERTGLERDRENGAPYNKERLAEIIALLPKIDDAAETIRSQWIAELDAAQKLLEARKGLHQAMNDGDSDQSVARQILVEAEQLLSELQSKSQDGEGLVRIEVDPDVIAMVVSDWTGIPLGKVLRDQAANILTLDAQLEARVRGQTTALAKISETIQTSQSGLKDPQQPTGVFLLVGPSGVGKTETAHAVADVLFGDEKSVLTINMSEYQEKHNVSKLIGSPPGYVGYGEGGILTESVRQRPYSVILLDEVEKADLDVMNLFYQVFDKGMLADGEGVLVDFSNTVIFLTSNLGTDTISELTQNGEVIDDEALIRAVRPLLSKHFKPALLARMKILPYRLLSQDVLSDIVQLKLEKLSKRVFHNNRIVLTYSDKVVSTIAERCTEVETGARNIDFILSSTLMPLLSKEILGRMTEGNMPNQLLIDINDAGEFSLDFSHHYSS